MVPSTVGIDTWVVDFVLLDDHDRMIGDAVAYGIRVQKEWISW